MSLIIEKGVEMKGLCRNIKRILPIIEIIYGDIAQQPVIVGTKWGHDHSRFPHESGNAIDVVAPLTKKTTTVTRLRLCLGFNYIVRDSQYFLHIEFCPMPELKGEGGASCLNRLS